MKPKKHSKAALRTLKLSSILMTAIIIAGLLPAIANSAEVELVEKQAPSAASTFPVLSLDIGIALGAAVLAWIVAIGMILALRSRREKECMKSIQGAFKTGMMQAVLPKIEEEESLMTKATRPVMILPEIEEERHEDIVRAQGSHKGIARVQAIRDETPAPSVYVGSHSKKPVPRSASIANDVLLRPLSKGILEEINDSMPSLNLSPIDESLGKKIPSLNARLETFGCNSENKSMENPSDFIDKLGALVTLTSANDDMMLRVKDNIRASDPIKVTVRRNESMTFSSAKNAPAKQVQLSKAEITSSLPDIEVKSISRMKFLAGIF